MANPDVLSTRIEGGIAVLTLGSPKRIFFDPEMSDALLGALTALADDRAVRVVVVTGGAPGYFVLGAAHAVLFWVSISVFTPFILLIGLFNARRRLPHDIVLGTVVINNSVRSPAGQPARTY